MRDLSLSDLRIDLTSGDGKLREQRLQRRREMAGSTWLFSGRSSVTNMYISSLETGLMPTLTLSPIHIA